MRNIISGLSAIVLIAGLATAACAAEEPADDKATTETPAAAEKPAGETPAAAEKPAGETPPAEEKPAAEAPAGEEKPAAEAPAGEEKPSGDTAAAGGECCKPDDMTPPLDLVKAVPKGGLSNPYNDKIAEIQDAGHKVYMKLSCNGCHGGGGGGGMCPPLTNQTWVYGGDDDTLFRLIVEGSDGLKAQGYVRKGSENVVGPMPPFGALAKSSDDVWRMITWIRHKNPDSVKLINKPVQ